jgi:hypothetical protein
VTIDPNSGGLRFPSRGVRIRLKPFNPVFRSAHLIIAPLTFCCPTPTAEIPDKELMTQYEIEKEWLDSTLDVSYRFDDVVLVKNGTRAGEVGRVISLFALEPFPHYMVEFVDGSSIAAYESDLERAA